MVDMEKVEEAFNLVLENTQTLETDLHTHFYDALIEQNVAYVEEKSPSEIVNENNKKLHDLNLTQEEWQKVYQFVLIKGSQEAKMQANHQFTPDSIAYIINFIIDTMIKKEEISMVELGSGMGNLAASIIAISDKKIDYTGFEVDDLLIDLSASIADVMQLNNKYIQLDAVRPQIIEPADVVLSDLPIGYYPDDEVASRFKVASKNKDEHTYAHHLLMEQGLKYLKDDGIAIFLAPVNLFNSSQAPELKSWLKDYAHLAAVIGLPETMFKGNPKALFVLQKKNSNKPTFVYNITSLTSAEVVHQFMQEFKESMV